MCSRWSRRAHPPLEQVCSHGRGCGCGCVRVWLCARVVVCVRGCVGAGQESLIVGACFCTELQSVDADKFMRAMSTGHMEPTRENYVMLLRVLGAHGRFDDAMEVAQGMVKDHGIRLDEFAYGALATSCASVGNVDAAFDIVDMMKEDGTWCGTWSHAATVACVGACA